MKRLIKKSGIFIGLKVEELYNWTHDSLSEIWDFIFPTGLIIIGVLIVFFPVGKLIALFAPSFFTTVQKANHSGVPIWADYWSVGAMATLIIGSGVFIICMVIIFIEKVISLIRSNWAEAERRLTESEFEAAQKILQQDVTDSLYDFEGRLEDE